MKAASASVEERKIDRQGVVTVLVITNKKGLIWRASKENKTEYYVHKTFAQGQFGLLWEADVLTRSFGVLRREGSRKVVKEYSRFHVDQRKRVRPDDLWGRPFGSQYKQEADASAADSLDAEVRTLQELGRWYALGADLHNFYLVMPWMGESMRDYLRQHRSDLRDIFIGACEALASIHVKNICHLDISPDNFVVSGIMDSASETREDSVRSCKVSLVDFGLSREQAYNGACQCAPTGCAGQLPYLAPECALDRDCFNGHAADIWSMGMVLYNMLSGHELVLVAHPCDEHYSQLAQIDGLNVVLKTRGEIVSSGVMAILSSTLKINPGDRVSIDGLLLMATQEWTIDADTSDFWTAPIEIGISSQIAGLLVTPAEVLAQITRRIWAVYNFKNEDARIRQWGHFGLSFNLFLARMSESSQHIIKGHDLGIQNAPGGSRPHDDTPYGRVTSTAEEQHSGIATHLVRQVGELVAESFVNGLQEEILGLADCFRLDMGLVKIAWDRKEYAGPEVEVDLDSTLLELFIRAARVDAEEFKHIMIMGGATNSVKSRILAFMVEASSLLNLITTATLLTDMWTYFQSFNGYVVTCVGAFAANVTVTLYIMTFHGCCELHRNENSSPRLALIHIPVFSLAAVWLLPLRILHRAAIQKAKTRVVSVLADDVPSLVVTAFFLRNEQWSWAAIAKAFFSLVSLAREVFSIVSIILETSKACSQGESLKSCPVGEERLGAAAKVALLFSWGGMSRMQSEEPRA